MKPPKLFRKYAADYYRLFLLDIDGVVWASNTYWAMPVPDDAHPVARLLALYNLSVTPGLIDVGETLVVSDLPTEVESLSKFADVVRSAPADLEPLKPHSLNEAPLYGYDENRRNMLALYALPGGRFVAMNDKYRRLVEESSIGSEWHGGPDPDKPVYRRNEAGQTTGLIMGVRCLATHVPAEVKA